MTTAPPAPTSADTGIGTATDTLGIQIILTELESMLMSLAAAVRAGDRPLAMQLAQQILQQLATEAADHARMERQVHALLADLDAPKRPTKPAPAPAPTPEELLMHAIFNVGIGGSFKSAKGVVYPVWFGTNRRPNARLDGFTHERDVRITRGRALVHVPEAHRFGETASSFWTRLRRFDLRDDALRLQEVSALQREDFFAELKETMQAAKESGSAPHALFFLHGYNVSFAEAAIRAAQIGYDLKVPGATAFFSWPSRATVAAYPADEASIEASERAITDFLVDFTQHCGAEKVHVIAHSMGNRGLLRALQRIAANVTTQGKVQFGQIFLAAPDIDRDLFLDLARLYSEHSERTTLYASDADLPVHLSAKLHDAPRAGYFKPFTVTPGVDTVAVPDFDIDLLGHTYFAKAEALLHDIYDLMRHDEAPAKRQRIRADQDENGVTFWRLAE